MSVNQIIELWAGQPRRQAEAMALVGNFTETFFIWSSRR